MVNVFKSKDGVLRTIALFLLIASFITLFFSFSTVYEEELWGSKGTLYSQIGRTSVETDYEYYLYNFFDRASLLREEGFGADLETVSIVLLVLSIVTLVLSLFIDFFKKFFFAPLPLAVAIVFILIASDNSTWYVLSMDYIGQTSGYNLYFETSIRFYMTLLPAIGASFAATAITVIAGIIHSKNNKKTLAAVQTTQQAAFAESIQESVE